MALVGPVCLIVLIFDMLLALCISFCFAEASSLFRETGGPYIYAKEAFGNFVGYEVGFLTWATRIIAFSTMAVGFATALSGVVPEWNTVWMKNVLSILVIAVLSGMNLCGVPLYKVVQNIATVGKLVPLILFIGMGVFFIHGSNFTPPAMVEYTPATFGATAILLFYAFTGFESICVAAGDMDNPMKNIPKATIITISLVSLIYFLLLAVCISIMGPNLVESAVRVKEAFSRICGSAGSAVVAAGTLVSIGGICIGSSFITPRSGLALAEQGMLPSCLAASNRFGAPYWCIIISGLIAMGITCTGTFTTLATISVVARFTQYIPTCLAVIVFRKTKKDAPRSFRLPFGNAIPILAILISFILLSQISLSQLIMGFGALVVAVPFYFLWKRKTTGGYMTK